VERVAVDLHIAANGHVCGRDESIALVNILVLSLVEELALDDARVLLGGLVDADAVIGQVERDDESTVDILGHASVELGSETKDLLVVVHGLEEVSLGLLRDQLVHLAKRVLLVTEAVIGRGDWLDGLGWLLELHLTQGELVPVHLSIVLLSEWVHAVDHVDAAVRVDVRGGRDLVASQVVVTDEVLTWLVDIKSVWQFLSAQKHSEGISAVVRVVALTNLESVVSQVVVHDVGQVLTACEEAKDAAIVVQELLLGLDFAATKALFHEVTHLRIVDARFGDLGLLEVVWWGLGGGRKSSSLASVELTSVVIAVVDADLTAVDASIAAN